MADHVIEMNWGEGHVYHKRHGDVQNTFRYPTLFMNFDVREEAALRRLFESRYHRVFSFRAEDYLDGRAGSLEISARAFLKEKCGYDAESISLQTYPRMFGYVFNPVSFWFCLRAGLLDAVLCEVRNTFGEKHFYWLGPSTENPIDGWRAAEKVFHVSPFQAVVGSYRFRFALTAEKSRVEILYYGKPDELRLTTSVEGRLEPIANARLGPLVIRYGWLTALVIVRIHSQAMRLWFKKAKFFSKPVPPQEQVTR